MNTRDWGLGRDGYYCLVTPEIIENYELVLALAGDDNPSLLTIQNLQDYVFRRIRALLEFAWWIKSYCMRKFLKDINSVWVFKNLAKDIQPYQYEYYGSKDDAIELAQIFQDLIM